MSDSLAPQPLQHIALLHSWLELLSAERRRRRRHRLRLIQQFLAIRSRQRHPDPEYVPSLVLWSQGYWRRASQYGDAQFRRHFRLTRTSFDRLHAALYGDGQLATQAFSSDFRVAVFLYRMATKQSCRELGELFDIGQSTVSRYTDEVARLVVKKLSPLFIQFPFEHDELFRLSRDFERLGQFPHVIGAIDGTHIDLERAPIVEGSSYFDRKKNYSIQMQAVVDNRGIFRDINIGWPGSVHDARVYSNSGFSHWIQSFYEREQRQHPSHTWYILGDVAYPLSRWLLTPYKIPEVTEERPWATTYNISHAKTRVPVENAFGRLKGRWRRLLCVDTTDVETATIWIHACVVLHNFCETQDDVLNEDELRRIRRRIQAQHVLASELADDQTEFNPSCDSDGSDSASLVTDTAHRDALAIILHEEWQAQRVQRAR